MGIPDQEHSAPSKLSETTCYDLAYACSDIICLALPKDLTVHMDVYFNPGLVQRRTDHLRSSLLAISAGYAKSEEHRLKHVLRLELPQ